MGEAMAGGAGPPPVLSKRASERGGGGSRGPCAHGDCNHVNACVWYQLRLYHPLVSVAAVCAGVCVHIHTGAGHAALRTCRCCTLISSAIIEAYTAAAACGVCAWPRNHTVEGARCAPAAASAVRLAASPGKALACTHAAQKGAKGQPCIAKRLAAAGCCEARSPDGRRSSRARGACAKLQVCRRRSARRFGRMHTQPAGMACFGCMHLPGHRLATHAPQEL